MLTSFDHALERPRFVDRQRLTADDLERTTAYVRERLRRHNRFLHGWGVVCGAQVRRADSADPWELAVDEGYLVTPGGAEVLVPPGLRVSVCEGARACAPGLGNPCDPDRDGGEVRETECVTFDGERRVSDSRAAMLPATRTVPGPVTVGDVTVRAPAGGALTVVTSGGRAGLRLADGVRVEVPPSDRVELSVLVLRAGLAVGAFAFEALNAAGAVVASRSVRKAGSAPTTLTLTGFGIQTVRVRAMAGRAPDGVLLGVCYRPLPDEGEPQTVYLVAEPEEAPACPRALVPPRCGPAGADLEPVRIREGLRLSIRCDLPDSHRPPPDCDALADRVCGRAHTPCPPAPDDEAVVLATLRVTSAGVVGVDDLADRRLLPSEALLHDYLRCQCVQLGEPPRPGAIAGAVRESQQGGALPGVTVFVRPADVEAAEPMGTVTDLDGRFVMRMLAPGPYVVAASFPGFLTASVRVEVTAGETAPADLVLRSRGGGGGGVVGPPVFVGGTEVVVEEIDRDLLDILVRGEGPVGGGPVVVTDRIEAVVNPPEPVVVAGRETVEAVRPPVLVFSPDETDLGRAREEGTRAVEGVGEARERTLRDAGIRTVVDLAASPPGRLAEVLGVSASRAAVLRGAAVTAMRRR